MLLLVAVSLGIAGLSLVGSDNSGDVTTGNNLHKASTIMFLVLVALFVYHTLALARLEQKSTDQNFKQKRSL